MQICINFLVFVGLALLVSQILSVMEKNWSANPDPDMQDARILHIIFNIGHAIVASFVGAVLGAVLGVLLSFGFSLSVPHPFFDQLEVGWFLLISGLISGGAVGIIAGIFIAFIKDGWKSYWSSLIFILSFFIIFYDPSEEFFFIVILSLITLSIIFPILYRGYIKSFDREVS